MQISPASLLPRTQGLDVVAPFNAGTQIVPNDRPVDDMPYRSFLSDVASARTALTQAASFLGPDMPSIQPIPEPGGVDPSGRPIGMPNPFSLAYDLATQALRHIEAARTAPAPRQAQEAVELARRATVAGIDPRIPTIVDPARSHGHFNAAVNWLSIAEAYATPYTTL